MEEELQNDDAVAHQIALETPNVLEPILPDVLGDLLLELEALDVWQRELMRLPSGVPDDRLLVEAQDVGEEAAARCEAGRDVDERLFSATSGRTNGSCGETSLVGRNDVAMLKRSDK